MTTEKSERSDRLSVLLVDDNERTQKLLASVLEQQPDWHMLKPVLSGEDALQMPALPAPNVVLLDYDMPGISGLKVLPLLREKWDDSYIIVLTHYDDELVRKAALTGGADDFWSKWDLDETRIEELGEVVRRRGARKQP